MAEGIAKQHFPEAQIESACSEPSGRVPPRRPMLEDSTGVLRTSLQLKTF